MHEFVRPPEDAATRILPLLPRTECGACGEPGCAPFAAALAAGTSTPEACTPGGALTAQRVRRLLGRARAPTREEFLSPLPPPLVARIRATDCIGCTKCLAPCPTDAIVGARRQLHGILAEDCTGCGLCLPPCPVDCIELEPREGASPPAPPGVLDALTNGPGIETCTDCGRCTEACPETLTPAPLARAVRALDMDTAAALGLGRCTACAACDEVCPPGIPLTAHFVHGRAVAAAAAAAEAQARHAEERQAARQRRLGLAPAARQAALVTPPPDRTQAEAGVAAALARARARRQA